MLIKYLHRRSQFLSFFHFPAHERHMGRPRRAAPMQSISSLTQRAYIGSSFHRHQQGYAYVSFSHIIRLLQGQHMMRLYRNTIEKGKRVPHRSNAGCLAKTRYCELSGLPHGMCCNRSYLENDYHVHKNIYTEKYKCV